MKDENKTPDAVTRRLPKYYRYLSELERRGEERISSSRMSEDLGLNASQIRRDLNCFGGFGQQGYGYSVEKLKSEVATILGLDKAYNMVIVGAGNIGQALIKYTSFARKGFNIVGVFDKSPELIGKPLGDKIVRDIAEIHEFAGKIDIGVIATPKAAAQETADKLVIAGVRGIWNFTPIEVLVRPGVSVENVHLNDSLYVLCFHMNDARGPMEME